LQHGIEENRYIDPAPDMDAQALSGEGTAPNADWIGGTIQGTRRDDGSLTAEHSRFVRRGAEYEDFDPGILKGLTPDVKVLAFDLPQFHAIPENDTFWGKGFTEWRQVARALPRYPGHYQPRLPGDLGFYDLSDIDVMRRQVALAQAAGIHGFGFYYYRFDDRRVLERPIDNFLSSPDIAMPFMLIWANENWTRAWDGQTGDLLLVQSYAEAAEGALLADIARHFADPRYIRVGGRPFFVIYQPRHVPNPRETFARWRRRWKDEHGVEPLIFMAQTFGSEDPTELGLDGAMEFPPHKVSRGLPERTVIDAFQSGFAARVFSYDDIVAASIAEPAPAYPLVKTAIPGWDNDPRRPMRGLIVEGSSPRKYQDWLASLVSKARRNPVLGERFVAINAWNEWAEGAYLEPDVHYGGAYLNATARALRPQR
jgi:lipopolysaccharide biosynthesis protein